LLCRDLIFTTKIKETAAGLGCKVLVANDIAPAKALIEKQRPRIVFVDLTAGDLCTPSALSAYREAAGLELWIVAFGPHVEADALAVAKGAGCQIVLTRSRFTSELGKLIRRYFI
jgi:hypothetical protein